MTPAALRTDLIARDSVFQAHNEGMRFRPADRLTAGRGGFGVTAQGGEPGALAARWHMPQAPQPIIPGDHYFSLWIDGADGPLPEFTPGHPLGHSPAEPATATVCSTAESVVAE
jgi:hypothetical protein